MSILNEGDIIPNFSLNSCKHGLVDFPNTKNKFTVLYFYPKDDTSGCTVEAKDFSILQNEFKNLDSEIFGISKDSLESHQKFINKHDLSIDLLTDDSEIAEKFAVWVEKNMYGRKYMGINRSTFIIDSNNKILKIWSKVKVKEHASEVLEYIKSL